MTINELKELLEKKNVPQHIYSLMIGGFPNEAFCLVKNENNWEVYYSERGKKRGAKQFSNETEACEYLEKKLNKYARV